MKSFGKNAIFVELKNFPIIRELYHFAYKPIQRGINRIRFYIETLLRHRQYQHELCDKIYDVSPELARKVRYAPTLDEAVELNDELLTMVHEEQKKRFLAFQTNVEELNDL